MATEARRELIERYYAPKQAIPADKLDELGRKILGAFDVPPKDWRTAWGIAEEIGVSEGEVLVYIDQHPAWFLRSAHSTGVLYSNMAFVTAGSTAVPGGRTDETREPPVPGALAP